jgi:hypothetical protein
MARRNGLRGKVPRGNRRGERHAGKGLAPHWLGAAKPHHRKRFGLIEGMEAGRQGWTQEKPLSASIRQGFNPTGHRNEAQ